MIDFSKKYLAGIKGAYIVGGSVRDIMKGRLCRDYDIVAMKNPGSLAREIAVRISGKATKIEKPGATLFRVVSKDVSCDISPPKGRTIEEDLLQRDFTINAMAYSPNGQRLIDPAKGYSDLKAETVRKVSDQALKKDPLRLVRAFRIAGELSFGIEPDTLKAIRENASLICQSAGERTQKELFMILALPESHATLRLMADARLLFEIFPELLYLKGCRQNNHHSFDVFEHTMKALESLENILENFDFFFPAHCDRLEKHFSKTRAILKCSVLLHDIGKPRARFMDKKGDIHFYGHELGGADMAKKICGRLKFSVRQTIYLSNIIKNHLKPLSLFISESAKKLTKKGRARFFVKNKKTTPDLIIHSMSDIFGKSDSESKRDEKFSAFSRDLIREYFDEFIPKNALPPLLTGHDLINEFALPPSPLFAEILEFVRWKRLSENLDRAGALELARGLIKKRSDGKKGEF